VSSIKAGTISHTGISSDRCDELNRPVVMIWIQTNHIWISFLY